MQFASDCAMKITNGLTDRHLFPHYLVTGLSSLRCSQHPCAIREVNQLIYASFASSIVPFPFVSSEAINTEVSS